METWGRRFFGMVAVVAVITVTVAAVVRDSGWPWWEHTGWESITDWIVVDTVVISKGDSMHALVRERVELGATVRHTRACNPGVDPGRLMPGSPIYICGESESSLAAKANP